MIEKLAICKSEQLDPYINLAVKRYLLESTPPGQCTLYLWQNKDTVVIGRNQNAWAECRVSLLEQEGGKLARRLSGGGAVFHDTGNLNFTFCCHEEDYDMTTQLSVIRGACRMAGIETEFSGRNDLLAQGRKFSGNAFYHSRGRAYHHGTILVSADLEKLGRYLSPPKAKLEAKGVSSVRSRVVNLSEFVPGLTCEKMKDNMIRAFEEVYGLTAEPVILSADAKRTIEKYAAEFAGHDWLFGAPLPFTCSMEERFPWGGLQLQLQVESGIIRAVQVYSDAMDHTLPEKLSAALTGCPFRSKSLKEALSDCGLDQSVCAELSAFFENQCL